MNRLHRSTAVARLASAALLIALVLAPTRAVPVAAGGGGSGGGQASASLRAGCQVGTNLPIDRCAEADHESPPGVQTWSVTDSRQVTAGGGVMDTSIDFRFDEVRSGDALHSVRVEGVAKVEQEGGGTATSDATYRTGVAGSPSDITITGSLSFVATGSDIVIASGNARVRILCGNMPDQEFQVDGAAGTGEPPSFAESKPFAVTIPGGNEECDIEVGLSAGSGTNQATTRDQTASAEARVQFSMTFGPAVSPTPETCSISGDVSDNDGSSRPSHALRGVQVELLHAGTALAPTVASNDDGTYCFHLPDGTSPVDAIVRATLLDGLNQPSRLQTRHASLEEPVTAEREVSASEFGRTDVDITFMPTNDRPWLSDVATIHYQSERFVRWLFDDVGLAPGLIGPLTILTGAEATNYSFDLKTARISAEDTVYADRSDAASECPENCEWHEIGHHVGNAIGLASSSQAPACEGRTPHGGWSNATTCDSLSEGFASFLSTLGSLDIDRTAGPGYATPVYSVFGSFEDNGEYPWSFTLDSDGERHYHEDHAVSHLLWDLADPAGDEHEFLWSEGDASDINPLQVYDRVDLGGRRFVHLLAASRAETVMDLYEFLAASPDLPADLKQRDPGFPETLAQDITPLQEAFLLHRFYPVPEPIDPNQSPRYTFGDTIGRTDRPGSAGGALVERRKAEPASGAAIRLVNDGDGPVAFSIAVAYPATSTELPVTVAPHSERLVQLELPSPWVGILEPGAALPSCDGEGRTEHRKVTVTVTAPGVAPLVMDSCAYVHAVATTTTGYAMSVSAKGPPQGAGGAPDMTTLLLIGAAAIVVLVVIAVLFLSRRGTARPAA